jgi:hypothetical protein
MFAFICWWWPRTWAKGLALDKREYRENAERRQRQRDLELAASEIPTGENTDIPGSEAEASKMSTPHERSTYVPPPVTPY